MEITSRQRANLKSIAMNLDPVVRIGKDSLTPEVVKSTEEALEARELVKIAVLNNCYDDIKDLAERLSARTRSIVVQTIGRRIVLYRPASDPAKQKISLDGKTKRKA